MNSFFNNTQAQIWQLCEFLGTCRSQERYNQRWAWQVYHASFPVKRYVRAQVAHECDYKSNEWHCTNTNKYQKKNHIEFSNCKIKTKHKPKNNIAWGFEYLLCALVTNLTSQQVATITHLPQAALLWQW